MPESFVEKNLKDNKKCENLLQAYECLDTFDYGDNSNAEEAKPLETKTSKGKVYEGELVKNVKEGKGIEINTEE